MKLSGKKVIITGGNRSIGQKMAMAFAREGAEIVISYCSDEKSALETIAVIDVKGRRKALALQVDFSNMEHVKRFAEAAIHHLGGVDILINNAGILCRETLFELAPEKMQEVFQINTLAPLYLIKLCAENMLERKSKGCILNISSVAGSTTLSRGIGYAASKAALNKLTQNAALDLAEHNIRVNAIAPGLIQAGMNEHTQESDPELWQDYMSNIPLGVPGKPDDIANMAVFLASDQALWITGKNFEIDGGQSL